MASAARVGQNRIKRLPSVLVDRIAAGEVIEAPHSVIKELCENALDAGASRLEIETAGAGIDLLRVADDGIGIDPEDLQAAIERHATSKIGTLADLDSILSFGFRGEALASIASVSHLEIRTRRQGHGLAMRLQTRGGENAQIEPDSWPSGTQIIVRELFYSTPARRKFMRTERAENIRNQQAIIRLALSRPDVEFLYRRDGKEYFHLRSRDSLAERIHDVFGFDSNRLLFPVEGVRAGLRLHGFVSAPELRRGARDWQYQFVNGRAVEIRHLSFMVRKAYGEMLPAGMHPASFLFFEIDPLRVDVNVHPAKREVRLLDESQFFPLIQESLDAALKGDMPLSVQQSRFQAPAFYRHDLDRVDVQTGELLLEAPPLPAKEYPVFAAELSRSDQPISRTAPSGSHPTGGGFRPLRHFGIIGGVFILAEDSEGLCIIDQHTAHERINYERIRKGLAKRRGARQILLHPTLISCLPDELDSILAQRQRLEAAGFVVDAAGPRSLALREVPEYIAADESSDLFARLIAGVIAGESEIDLFDDYAAMKACKASIKRNDYVAGETLSEILRQLAECEDPSRCPHGRPTMMRISISDLDAMFQRSS